METQLADYYGTIARMLKWRLSYRWGEESTRYNEYTIYRKKRIRYLYTHDRYNYSFFGFGRDVILGSYTLPQVLEYLDNRAEYDFAIQKTEDSRA